jgi:CelD/BcsL family acetyltransferase involved in cellulose biosynthesis
MPAPLEVTIYDEFTPELSDIWRRLERDSDHLVFQCLDWLHHWHRTVGSAARVDPCIAVVRDHDGPLALFPFARRRAFGVRILEFLGGAQCDCNAPLLRRACARDARAVWGAVADRLPAYDLLLLERVPRDLDSDENPWMAAWPLRESHRAWLSTLPPTWAEYIERIPKKVRNDSRRQRARLAALGNIAFAVAKSDEEFDRFVAAMIEQKRRKYRETGARDMLASESTRAFYTGLRGALGAAGMGRIHMSALHVGDSIVATHWGAVYGKRFYYLMPAFESGRWRALSVGRILQEELLQWTVEKQLECFDFSVGDEPYKRIWCDRQTTVCTGAVSPSIRGSAFLAAARAVDWCKSNETTRSVLMAASRSLRRIG